MANIIIDTSDFDKTTEEAKKEIRDKEIKHKDKKLANDSFLIEF